MKIIITGAAGLLGARLTNLLSSKHHVVAVVHRNAPPIMNTGDVSIATCDLTDKNAVRTLINSVSADVVVNSAAMTDVDRCEEDKCLAHALNCGIVHNLLNAIDGSGTRFVQVSTDYLFDGEEGPYSEDASANPLNVYGHTKLAAEARIRKWDGSGLIVRTSALFDSADYGKTNLFTSIYSRLKSNKPVYAASDLFCNPIWAENLSRAIMEAVDLDLTGILNIAGGEYMSRYDFAISVATAFGFSLDTIRAVPIASLNRRAKRPLRAGVDITKATSLLHTILLSPSQVFTEAEFR